MCMALIPAWVNPTGRDQCHIHVLTHIYIYIYIYTYINIYICVCVCIFGLEHYFSACGCASGIRDYVLNM